MLRPLYIMAHVLILFSFQVVQAQSSDNNSLLCYVSADNSSHQVDAVITQAQPYTVTCTYSDGVADIPRFLQFSCSSASNTSLTIQVNLTDGDHQQTITKDVIVNVNRANYEVPVLAFVSNELIQSGKARIKSIVFSNNMNVEVDMSKINFSNSTSNYEVKMNQVFTVDMKNSVNKNYYISANVHKDVCINVYKQNGEFDQKITKSLAQGENFIRFDDMQVKQGKYMIVITDYDPKKSPSSKITVMN